MVTTLGMNGSNGIVSGSMRPPAYTSLEKGQAIVFDRTDTNHWNVSLQTRHGRPHCLGAIEYNTHLECWYITHIGRNTLSKAESLPFLGWLDSSTYLHEQFLCRQEAAA